MCRFLGWIGLAAVLALLRFVPTSTRGAQQRGPCPVHGSEHASTSRCLSANTQDNTFQCFKCGAHGNALDLWAAVTGQNTYDAAADLCHRLGQPVPAKGSGPSGNPGNREEERVANAANFATLNPSE